MKLSRCDHTFLVNAIEDALAEFEELSYEKEWFVTSVTDKLESALVILAQEESHYDGRTSTVRQKGLPGV